LSGPIVPPPLAGEGQLSRSDSRERGQLFRKRAKAMRANATPAEHRLWQILRAKCFAGYKFKRQVTIDYYIVDFVCLSQRLIIEADGGHSENAADERRDAYLKAQGFRVARFWNNDIFNNEEEVSATIFSALADPSPSRSAVPSGPLPLPQGERGMNGALHG